MRFIAAATLALFALATPVAAGPDPDPTAALRNYISAPDTAFKWSVRHTGEMDGVQLAELRLVSQVWRGQPWKHRLYVMKPVNLRNPKQAVLFISGGSWRDHYDQPPSRPDWPGQLRLAMQGAEQSGTCLVMLEQVPFQPMFGGMKEDQLIAYSFAQWLASGDDSWPLLFPMVKSAVRAMDAAQNFLKREWNLQVDTFTVTGASKRGWTTWLTGASDARVNAIAPMVIDVLNMAPQMRHQLAAWGKYSPQIADYTQRGLPDLAGTPKGQQLLRMVDPFSYRKQLQQPKLLFIGTNDAYWPVDACNLYWDGLEGPKYLCYVPNNGHGLMDFPRILGGLSALSRAAAGERSMPEMSWNFEPRPDGGLRLTVRLKGRRQGGTARLWAADSPTRDFRSARWIEREWYVEGGVTGKGSGIHGWRTFDIPRPETGWTAAFAEIEFPDPRAPTGQGTLYLSTNLRVLQSPEPEDF